MKKIKVACYVRVSTQEQATKGYSIGEQIERLKAYCAAMKWDDVTVYSDPGFSGASLERPGIQNLIMDCEAGKIDKVVVYKLDRLSRSQKDTLHLIEDVFQKSDTDFISLSESFDTSTPFGKAAIGMLSVFAQLEREQIKERMMMGADARAKEGKYHGSSNVPIGYRYDFSTGHLVADDAEKLHIQFIYSEFLKGKSPYKITEALNSMQYRSSYGKYIESTIRYILKNRTYCGYIRNKSEWVKAPHEAIISEPDFEQAQELIRIRFEKHSQHNQRLGKATSYLGGFLYCKCCGAKYGKVTQHYKNKDYLYYRCNSKTGKKPHLVYDKNCNGRTWKMEELDGYVFEEIKKIKLSNYKAPAPIIDTTKAKKTEIKRLKTALSRTIDLYTLSNTPDDMLRDKIQSINRQIESLQAQITAENTPKREECIRSLNMFDEALKRADLDEIRSIIAILIDRIELDNSDVTIFWNF